MKLENLYVSENLEKKYEDFDSISYEAIKAKVEHGLKLDQGGIDTIDFKGVDSKKVTLVINFLTNELYKFEKETKLKLTDQEIDEMMSNILEKLQKAEKDFSGGQLGYSKSWIKTIFRSFDIVTNGELVIILKEFIDELKIKKIKNEG